MKKEDGNDLSNDVVIYGAGRCCEKFINRNINSPINIRAIFDMDKSKQGKFILNIPILNVEQIVKYKNYLVLICIADINVYNQIKEELVSIYKINPGNIYNRAEIERLIVLKKMGVEVITSKKKSLTVIFESRYGFGLGGIESWTKCIVGALSEKGINVRVLARENSVLDERISVINDNHLDYYSALETFFKSMFPCVFVSSQPTEELMIASVLKELYPEYIDIISVIHGGLEQIYDGYMTYEKWISKFICVSRRIQNAFLDKGVSSSKLDTMTCPFKHVEEINKSYIEESEEPLRLGYAGRIEYPQKRIDLIIKLIQLMEQADINYIFEIAGDGPAKCDLEQFITECKTEHVILKGIISHERIMDFWKTKDIAINLSDYEGHSISQLEAMECGVIPIVTDTSGTEDDICDNENGFIVPLEDANEAFQKIYYLYENRNLIPIYSKKAREAVHSKGKLSAHLKQWEKEIECASTKLKCEVFNKG